MWYVLGFKSRASKHQEHYQNNFAGQQKSSSWLGARRRPRHETVFLLVHCTGATARAHFFLFFLCFASVKPLFLSFFVVFFWRGVGWGGGGWGGGGGCNNVLWTWAHLGCYVMRSFLGIQHIWDGTSWDLFLEFNTSGMLCHEIFSWNSTHLGWCVMRSFLGIQYIWDGTSWDVFFEFNTSGMVRHEIFSWNSTHLGWYVMRSFLEFNTSFSLNFLFFWKHKKGDDATLHEHVSLEVFQWAWRNHALLGKNPSEVLEQLSRFFAD